MNAVIGLAQLALDQTSDPTLGDYLRQMYSSATSLLRIINDILDYSKIEAGRLSLEHKEFLTDQLSSNLLGMFGAQAAAKGVSLSTQIAPDVPAQLIGDSLRLDQVLINLVSNAIKFTDSGSIVIEIERLDQNNADATRSKRVRLRFCVVDTGLGMTKETQAGLFQPFIQADGSITRRFGGTGLGLTISRRLVMLMGGDISVVSDAGVGSRFCFDLDFHLPAQDSLANLDTRSAQASLAEQLKLAEVGRAISGARVLLVDDDLVTQRVTREMLRRAGLHVIVANHGGEALEFLGRERVDAVLMDIAMPEVDGFVATQRIRANPAWSALPIIAFTAAVLLHDREKCLAAGMNDFISKPSHPLEIINILTRHIAPQESFTPVSGLPIPPEGSTVTVPFDRERATIALRTLKTQLEQNAFIATNDVRALRLQLAGISNPAANRLYDAISRYDYASAKRVLNELLTELGLMGDLSA